MDLVLDVKDYFEEQLKRPVSIDEARNLLGNLADYMWMLVKWEIEGPDAIPETIPPVKRGRPTKHPKKTGPRRPRGRPRKNPLIRG